MVMNVRNIKDLLEPDDYIVGSLDRVFDRVTPVDDSCVGSICFCNESKSLDCVLGSKAGVIVLPMCFSELHIPSKTLVFAFNPKLVICRVIKRFYDVLPKECVIVSDKAFVHSSCVLGVDGFGFVLNSRNVFEKFPHIGGVVVEDGVEIFANVCVARGSLNNSFTRIGEGSKVDNFVHVAHNVVVGRNCLLVSHSNIGGGVVLGDNCFVGMGATIKNKVRVGSNVVVGMGSVVLGDVPDNWVVVGNPARFLRFNDGGGVF